MNFLTNKWKKVSPYFFLYFFYTAELQNTYPLWTKCWKIRSTAVGYLGKFIFVALHKSDWEFLPAFSCRTLVGAYIYHHIICSCKTKLALSRKTLFTLITAQIHELIIALSSVSLSTCPKFQPLLYSTYSHRTCQYSGSNDSTSRSITNYEAIHTNPVPWFSDSFPDMVKWLYNVSSSNVLAKTLTRTPRHP